MRIPTPLVLGLLAMSLRAQAPSPTPEPPKPEEPKVTLPAPTVPPVAPVANPEPPTAPVPPAAETKPAEPAPVAKPAILYFYRESRFVGAALRPSIFVDDVEVAYLSSGSYLKVAVKPGDHSIYADEKKDALTFPVEAGKTYYFRVAIRAGFFKGHGKIEPVDETTGVKETTEWKADLKYTEKILKPEMIVKD